MSDPKQESVLNQIKGISFDPNKEHNYGIKSGILWGLEEGCMYPLAYIMKPKNISQEDFDLLLQHIRIIYE